jgi:hypothetical protein
MLCAACTSPARSSAGTLIVAGPRWQRLRLRRTAEHAGLGNRKYTFRGDEPSLVLLSDLRWVRYNYVFSKVKLSDTEALSADLYHYPEEITRKKIPFFGRQQEADRQELRDD